MRCRSILWAFAVFATVAMQPQSDLRAEEPEDGSEIAIYRDGLALMTVRRTMELPEGETRLATSRLSPGLIPESLHVEGDGVRLLDLDVSPWPISQRRLLQSFLGEEVLFLRPTPDGRGWIEEEAEIVALDEGVVLRIDGRIEVDPAGRFVFPELPEPLLDEPRAVLRLHSEEEGARTVTLRYLTRGVSWRNDVVAQWDGDAGRLNLTAMATLRNDQDRSVAAERAQLVAGEVALEPEDAPRQDTRIQAMRAESAPMMPEAEARADLHVYRLDDPLTLDAHGIVRRALLEARAVEVETIYRIEGLAVAQQQREVRETTAQLRLEIPDTRAAGLDQALPAGIMRVYADGLFRGARQIGDTPVGASLTLDLGEAFDVTAESRQTAFERIGDRSYESAQEVVLRNASDREIEAEVIGSFPEDWRMIEESHPHERRTASEPVWTVAIPAEGEETLTYRVRVSR